MSNLPKYFAAGLIGISMLAISPTASRAAPPRDTTGEKTTARPQDKPAPPTIDTNNDGKPDAWDRNGDGKPDAWDTNGDGQPDVYDNEQDGRPDPSDGQDQQRR